ncbi:KEOPS complex subunit Pcc1 [Sulfurisphaera javensis]|uniref:KEOPS complex subunit Pcc1 n=1 Tax=Sulfurisphaera javensis TaxID=2049879 RepID=A0AAT9GP70_9CREN
MKISIRVTYDTKYAKEIAESIKVDNINLPQGMIIETNYEKDKIIVNITMEINEPRNILTLRNTIDEILQHISAIEKTISQLSH